jgi:hypothetical protein
MYFWKTWPVIATIGRRVHVRVGDGADEVGGAGAAGGHAHADLAGGAGVTFGGEGAALFVAGQDDADLVRAGEGLVQLLGGAAGVGENDIDVPSRSRHSTTQSAPFISRPISALGKRSGRGRGFHSVGKGCGIKRIAAARGKPLAADDLS